MVRAFIAITDISRPCPFPYLRLHRFSIIVFPAVTITDDATVRSIKGGPSFTRLPLCSLRGYSHPCFLIRVVQRGLFI
jgi:hypothetical protein